MKTIASIKVLCVGLLIAPGIRAQSAPASAPADDSVGLQEVVITAERRSEDLQKSGLAISAVTGDDLEKAGITDVQAITNLVPAVQIGNGGGPYSLFYLRGVGNFSVNPLSDSAISFNVDGVPINRPSSTSGAFYDLDRIEVLKGPQGTLYGRNATGGAINVITKQPELHETSGNLSADFGNYASRKFEGALNLPLGDIAAVRGAFSTNEHNGYLSDGTDDDKGAAGRVHFLIAPSEAFNMKVGGDFYHQGGHGGGGALLTNGFSADQRVGNSDPRAQAAYASTLFFPAGSFMPGLPESAHSDNKFWGLNAELNWISSLGTLTVVPAYRHVSLDYSTPGPGLFINEQTVSKDASVEARFVSPDNQPLRWLIGTYYLDEKADTTLNYNSGFNFFNEPNLTLPVKSASVFGRLTYALTDSFRLTGGLRYTRDRKDMDATASSSNILCFAALNTGNPFACLGAPGFPYFSVAPEIGQSLAMGGAPVPWGTTGTVLLATPITPNLSRTFTKTTWRGAAEWDLAPQSLMYASVETGFKAGGYFVANVDPVYNPETITAYTLGSKNRFLDNRVQLDAEVFYWKYKDQQYSHILQQSDGAIVLATQNVGRSTIQGVELDGQFAVAKDTLFGGDIQYLKATYDNFVFDVPAQLGPPVANCPFQPSGANFTVDCSGRAAPESPRWTVALNAEQKMHLGSAGIAILGLSTKYQSSTFAGIEYLDSERQSAYWMSNVQLTFVPTSGRWTVGTYVNNIENAAVKNDAFPQTIVGAALVSSFLRPPRTFGVRGSITW